VREVEAGVARWNQVIAKGNINFKLKLPHVAFNRAIGEFSTIHVDPEGNILDDAAWAARKSEFLPSSDDAAYIGDLMKPVFERGRYAGWIAPPRVGIDNKPGDFEYVRIA